MKNSPRNKENGVSELDALDARNASVSASAADVQDPIKEGNPFSMEIGLFLKHQVF